MMRSSCRPGTVVLGAGLILPAAMLSGFVWWALFIPFVERIAEAGFLAGLLLGPAVSAFVTARWCGGSWCSGAAAGVLFALAIAVLGTLQSADPDPYDVAGFGVTAAVSGAAAGLLGTPQPPWRTRER